MFLDPAVSLELTRVSKNGSTRMHIAALIEIGKKENNTNVSVQIMLYPYNGMKAHKKT